MLEGKSGCAKVSDYFKGFLSRSFYLHMIFTLDIDFEPTPHKMLPPCATLYKVNEKLQKEKHDTLRKTSLPRVCFHLREITPRAVIHQ